MTDVLANLEGLMDELPGAVDRRRLGDRLNQALTTLRDADLQVGRLAALFILADETEFGRTQEQQFLLSEVKREAWEVGGALETAETDNELRDAVWDYEKEFLKAVNALDRASRSWWSAFTASRFQPLVGFGDLLAKIDGVADLGQRLADCGRRAQAQGAGGSSVDFLASVREFITELDALQAERVAAIGAGEVGDFLNALAERRATLNMVTPDVYDWLTKNQALERFKVAPS
ncbi:hypothetical protein NKH63_28630 [Mesorhizobium sp. M0960]|uniref:hypothetical protein n=1 Tax=Mesorhizobium sp. M0960 TaxID=2957035 RepID=UPI003339F80C